MVHEGKKGRMAVVTVLYKIGRADTFLRSVRTYVYTNKNLLTTHASLLLSPTLIVD